MTAQLVVGLYESKGYAQDARNRLEQCREAARIVPEMIVEGEAQ